MGVHVTEPRDTPHLQSHDSASSKASLPKFRSRVVIIALNESGKRIGETHHNARISDEMVDRIRELHEDCGWTRRQIAAELQIAYWAVHKIVYYQRRAQTPSRWKRIKAVVPVSCS